MATAGEDYEVFGWNVEDGYGLAGLTATDAWRVTGASDGRGIPGRQRSPLGQLGPGRWRPGAVDGSASPLTLDTGSAALTPAWTGTMHGVSEHPST